MRRTMRYSDAVSMLGGDSAAVTAIDRALGGALLVASGGTTTTLAGLLGARQEVMRVCHGLVNRVRDRRIGASRFDRTQRLMAAYTVLAIVAYFEDGRNPATDRKLPRSGG